MVADIRAGGTFGDPRIAARIERLPLSGWHIKIGLIIGTAWFFDGFDALAIAYVLPVLIPLWKMAPSQIGLLISIGYVGQCIGAVFFGRLAERIGRVRCMVYTIAIYSVMSLVCVFAWDLDSMMTFRFLQGLGLGGEVPVVATYVAEFVQSERRGRVSLSCQLLFAIGLTAVAFVARWVVPNFGWQGMFVIGALPALITVPMRWLLPESPRWLASRGRLDEADRELKQIEDSISGHGARPLPPLPEDAPPVVRARTRFAELFSGLYLRRTLSIWLIWITTYLVTYGLAGWLPSIYRTVYHLSVVDALQYGFLTSLAGLAGAVACILLIDFAGRKPLFTVAQFITAIPLLILAFIPTIDPSEVLLLVMVAFGFNNVLALGLAMYTSESYPTEIRALGSGVASAWQRAASVVGPFLIGAILPTAGLGAVFGVFGAAAFIGGLVALFFAVETKAKVLEQVSPSV